MKSIQYTLFFYVISTENTKCTLILNFLWFHLTMSKIIILPNYLTSDIAFEKRLINVYLQRSFNVLLPMLDKLSKNDIPERFTQRKH